MRILHVIAQKPNSTGSGVYVSELVKALDQAGHTQAVVAGITRADRVELPEKVQFHPVFFESEKLPFPVVGMSDEMPYPSTRYRDLTDEMTARFEQAFLDVLRPLIDRFHPDVILSHHLYLLTALIRDHFPKKRVYGFCHNTDLRQMQKTPLKRDYIRLQIQKLDGIFVPQHAQQEEVIRIYGADPSRIRELGMGYNSDLFFPGNDREPDGKTRLIYAGKIAEKKGVKSLLRSLSYLPFAREEVTLSLAGGVGSETEYDEILSLARACPYEVHFLGKLPQTELADVYRASDIFVLPSFFDGLPLTVIEALACGDRVVMSDLPGMQDWIRTYAPGGDVRFVPLPVIRHTDEADPASLPAFEERLAQALSESIRSREHRVADVSALSWAGLAKRLLAQIEKTGFKS